MLVPQGSSWYRAHLSHPQNARFTGYEGSSAWTANWMVESNSSCATTGTPTTDSTSIRPKTESRGTTLENQNFYHASDEEKAWYYRAGNFLNNRKNYDEDLAAETFVSGRI